MIYVDTCTMNVSLCLACEYYLATERILGDDVLLLWRTEPTLVSGKFQNIYEEIDVPWAREHGINIVRRMSGGGTVYSDPGCCMYSFIGKSAGGIDFERYMTPVIEVLRSLDIPVIKNGRNDMEACGKKVSGNAQYTVGDVTVHHGTLLFSTDLEVMARATTLPDYKITSKSIKSVRERVINMSELTDKVKTPEEFASYLREGLAGDTEYVLTDYDKRRIDEIAEEHFRLEMKNGISTRSPRFDFERSCTFEGGGSVIFRLSVKEGVVQSAEILGDFFSTENVENLRESLTGTLFTADELASAVRNSGFFAMGITNDELAEALSRGIA